MLTFICYPQCSTCKKAQKWLDEQRIAYALRNIKTENPTSDELRLWHSLSAQPLKKLFNTSGLVYRSLGLKDRLSDMSEEEQLALLSSDGMLIKRPLLVGDDFVLIGFNQAKWEEKLTNK